MASRYSTGGGTSDTANKTVSTNGTQSTAGATSSSTDTSTSQNTNTKTSNMDTRQLAALNKLIAQLAGGGTPEMQQAQAQRDAEIAFNRDQRAGYSKEAAFSDAQGAMAQALRMALDKSLPMLVRASQGAGSSQNSMRALLLQQAQEEAAQNASALGLKAAVDYGGISTNLSSILERLTTPNDPATSALIQALNVAKGATTTTNSNTTGSSTSNTVGTSNQVQNTSNVGSTNIGTGGSAPMYSNTNSLSYFGGDTSTSPMPTVSGSGWSDNSAALQTMLGGLTNRWQGFNDI